MFSELYEDSTLRDFVLVTNMWENVSREDGEERERELITNFKTALDKGAQIARHYNTVQSAHDIIRHIMKNQPDPLQIQRELVDECMGILKTAVGEAINRELNEQIQHHQAELKTVKSKMDKALREKDEETKRELEKETRKLQEHIDRTRADLKTITSRYNEERKRMEEEIRWMREDTRQEVDQAHAEHMQQLEQLVRVLEAHADAERRVLVRQVDELQEQLEGRDQSWTWRDVQVALVAASVAFFTL